MIICGFPGVGKTMLSGKHNKCIDLDSSSFDRHFDLYSDIAIKISKSGYNVLVSTHKELRNLLSLKGEKYKIVIPDISCKDEYLERYSNRGSSKEFIKYIDSNWELFINDILNNEPKEDIIILDKGQTLYDVINVISE